MECYHAFHDWDDPVRIKTVILAALDTGLSHKDVLQLVLRQFPRAQTTIKCVQWYASKQRKEAGTSRPTTPDGIIPEAIEAGFTNQEVREYVHSLIPDSTLSLAAIAVVRYKMRQRNPAIRTNRQLRGLA